VVDISLLPEKELEKLMAAAEKIIDAWERKKIPSDQQLELLKIMMLTVDHRRTVHACNIWRDREAGRR
jgi:hypothetical protein